MMQRGKRGCRALLRPWGGFCVALLAACGDGDSSKQGHLIGSSPEGNWDQSAEDERIRRMQLLRVLGPDGQPAEMPITSQFWQDAGSSLYNNGQFGVILFQQCFNYQRFKANRNLERVTRLKCLGDVLLSMATEPGTVTLSLVKDYQIDDDDDANPDDSNDTRTTTFAKGEYKVLPQNAATNAKLAEAAALWYGATIRKITGYVDAEAIDLGADGSVSRVHATEELGSIFVDSYYAGKEAYEVALRNTLAAADEGTAGVDSPLLKQRRAISSPAASRMKAAHLMIGGPQGFLGDVTTPYCTSGRLSGPAQAALKLLREAGVAPDDVLDTQSVTTAALVNALPGASKPVEQSVRARLGDAWEQTTTVPDIFTLYSLTEADFDAARRQLIDEINIWSRSTSAKLPLADGAEGFTHKYRRFGATAVPPQARDPWYWAALAQTGVAKPFPKSDPNEWYHATQLVSDRNPPTNYAAFVGRSIDSAEAILTKLNQEYAEVTDPEARGKVDQFRRPLLHLLSQGDQIGTFTQCNLNIGPTGITTIAVTTAAGVASGARYVVGDDVMSCATTGAIDGTSCTLALADKNELDGPPRAGRSGFSTVSAELPSNHRYDQRVYVIVPKVAGNTAAGAGGWKVLLGTPIFSDRKGCRDVPIVPDAAERVAQAMAPSPEWCGRSLINCNGKHFDERIPLEDELTNDQDGVESSWKHYLALAKDAAAESDRLGEDYINSSIAVDQRDEELSLREQQQREKAAAELEVVQDICGTSVNIDPLLKALGQGNNGDVDLHNVGSPCKDGDDEQPGTTCLNGQTVLDWQKIGEALPETQDLAKCIADFTDTTTTTLGNDDVCAWRDTDKVLCGSKGLDTDGYACPDIKRSSGKENDDTLRCRVPSGATATVLATRADSLGLFSTAETLAKAPAQSLCDNIRSLRAKPANQGTDRQELLDAIVNSNMFDPGRLGELRKRLQFEATLGGYFNLNVDGKSVFTSGSVDKGPSKEWPCAASTYDCQDSTGLFCWKVGCAQSGGAKDGLADSAGLQAAAQKLFNAVAAAQLSTYSGPADPPQSVWRPLYLMHGAVPLGNQTQVVPWNYTSTSKTANEAFSVYSNDNWKYFISTHNSHSVFEGFGHSWNINGDQASQFFTIGRMDPVNPEPLRAQFWGGLSTSDEGKANGDRRYLYTLLSNGSAAVGLNREVNYGEDIWVNVDGNGDEHHDRVLHALRGWNLETGNWSDEVARYAEVAPITYKYDQESLLDGLELLCEVSEQFGDRAPSCSKAPTVTGVADLSEAGSYLTCLGDRMTNAMALVVFPDFPTAALDKSGLAARKGQLGTAVSDLRSALLRVSTSGPTIARTVRDFGLDMKRLRETIHQYELDDKIQDVQFRATEFQDAATCVSKGLDSTASTFAAGSAAAPVGVFSLFSTIATCTNSFAQIQFASTLTELRKEQNAGQRGLATIDFNERFSAHVEALEKQSIELASAQEEIQRHLGTIEGLHAKARRSVGKAIWYLSQQAAKQAEVSAALAGRSKTAQLRYDRAFENAKRLAFLAGRAIEQRLGVNLTDMTEALPLVDAPATWAPSICTTSGIDYARLRTPQDGAGGSSSTGNNAGYTYADAYIGDYIRKLENVVESYRLVQNFHEGDDTAVVSLRDDIFNLRKDCEIESPNLLYWASALDRLQNDKNDSGRIGWVLRGCGVGPDGLALPNCIGVLQHEKTPFVDLRPQLRSVPGFTVKLGTTTGSRIVQTVALEAGTYRFSWYTADGKDSAGTHSGFVRLESSGDVTKTAEDAVDATQSAPWVRPWFTFKVELPGVYEVGFRNPGNAASVTIAAPMLEQVQVVLGATSSNAPKMFSNTTDKRTSVLAVCQDTDGSVFRQKEWSRGCTYLCPDGYSSDCSTRAKQACYWETSFNVSQREIEAGHQFKASGFARGNFNYRIESLGLNFVGTSLRGCDQSDTPSACYSGGFIPYSLIHAGPYIVRNRQGLDYDAKLFTGNIEHARGLATERYFSNPMSDADRSLFEAYLRKELQGRPLDGDFLIRIWDEDGVQFNDIEDVQVVLKYRYWTRFN